MEVPVIIEIGSSNVAGFAALLSDVSITDRVRWLGAGAYHPPIPSTPSQRPYEVRTPGIRMLSPRRPYSTNVSRDIVGVGGGAGTIDYGGAPVDAAVDSWVYVRTSSTIQGALFKVQAASAVPAAVWPFFRAGLLGGGAGSANRLRVAESVGPTLSLFPFFRAGAMGGTEAAVATTTTTALAPDSTGNWGTIHFLQDSATISAVDLSGKRITSTAASSPGFDGAVVGRFVQFFFDNSIRKITARDGNSITVDLALNLRTWTHGTPYGAGQYVIDGGVVYLCATSHTSSEGVNDPANGTYWTPQPTASTGFCVLTGANACETLADLASPTKCVLQDMTFYLDQNAPVFLTGLDYCNYDATPFQNPRVAYGDGTLSPTINSIPELAFQVRSELSKPLVVVQIGISASMISPFLQGASYAPGAAPPYAGFTSWFHDILSLDWHPTSPNALFTAITNAITATNALLAAEGNTPKYHGIFINLFDNDPADAQRVLRLRENTERLRDALRAHIGDTTVPFTMAGPSRYGGLPSQRVTLYDALNAIAASDAKSGVFDARQSDEIAGGVFSYPEDYAADALHYSASGQIKKARGYFDAWKAILDRAEGSSHLFVVEDGSGLTNANSYCSIADADDYHEQFGNPTDWTGATEADKEEGLRVATRVADERYGLRWKGTPTSSTQSLAWPRNYVYDAIGNAVGDDHVPGALRDWVARYALLHLQGEDAMPATQAEADVRSESKTAAGGFSKSVTYAGAKTATKQFPALDRMLEVAGLIPVAGGWGWAVA